MSNSYLPSIAKFEDIRIIKAQCFQVPPESGQMVVNINEIISFSTIKTDVIVST